jgi:hypothetical protein
MLPPWLPELRITNLGVGQGAVDLLVEREHHDVGITALRRDGNLGLVVVK